MSSSLWNDRGTPMSLSGLFQAMEEPDGLFTTGLCALPMLCHIPCSSLMGDTTACSL